MNIVEIIIKKKNKEELSFDELNYVFSSYLVGDVTDYQMSALLMAICINGMNDEEIIHLNDIFINSGEILDLNEISGVHVDKHSTGGIGDKVTLIIGPIVAAAGLKVPKMSGRSLGITGGTIDKLESIPGFKTELDEKEFFKLVNEVGFAVTSQTKNLVPLDKKVYSLRDVTGTTDSLPLIASSIMSKKIASGSEKIVIDIKVGKGALIKNNEDAKRLSRLMITIGKNYNKEVRTIISDMNVPLGYNIGNSLEILEVIEVLQGKENHTYLANLSFKIAATMISLGKNISIESALEEVDHVISSNLAYNKFLEFVQAQGGNLQKLTVSIKREEILSKKSGYIKNINAEKIGELALKLGAGRMVKTDNIDHTVGVVLNKQVNEYVSKNEKLMTLYINEKSVKVNIDDFFEIEDAEII